MATTENILERYAIPDLMEKNFFIPDYQRGYRWTEQQIFQLLSDLYQFFKKPNSGAFYCLQPIIVKKCDTETIAKYALQSQYDDNTWYEVIDGQQRLTTIRLIITFNNLYNNRQKIDNCFRLFYQTRPELGRIFEQFGYDEESGSISCPITELDIDSFHVKLGLDKILEWFSTPGAEYDERETLQKFPIFFGNFFGEKIDFEDDDDEEETANHKSVQVLWYELKDGSNPRDVFKRLNDNKIALTNSELIRALFLSESSEFKLDKSLYAKKDLELARKLDRERKQGHISEQWDIIEHHLRNSAFWAFVTNNSETEYSCRIEYIFDLISKKHFAPKESPYGLKKTDPLYTYLFFDRELARWKKEQPSKNFLWELWQEIETYYSTLVNWFEDRDYYHFVGYLVRVVGDSVLADLLSEVRSERKDLFRRSVIQLILSTVNLDYDNLKYPDDNFNIEKILTLYNIETYRKNSPLGFFPFKLFKDQHWTIEHIHAQNSEGLPKDDNDALLRWLDENIKALQQFKLRFPESDESEIERAENLIADLQVTRDKGRKGITYQEVADKFDDILRYFNSFLEKRDLPSKIHEFSNLTLLSGEMNTSIGKSAFEVKRQKIVKMDAEGEFIPYCTKKVFMKYCNIQNEDFVVQQTSYWSDDDRLHYQEDIMTAMNELNKEAAK